MVKKKILNYLHLHKSFGIEYSEPITFNKPINRNENLPTNIEQLDNYVEHCNLCELSKSTHKKRLGFGKAESNVYIVALSCDFQNKNIIKILSPMVEDILELNMSDIYLTNLIKCTIKHQNGINKENINLCKEYFIKQIDIIRPKYIIALGEVSHYLLKNKNDLSYINGTCYKYDNSVNVIPMLDLEYVYKNPSYKDELSKDFKKLKILMGKR